MTTIAIDIVNLESIQIQHNSHKLYCIPILIPCLMGFYLPIYSDSKKLFYSTKKELTFTKKKKNARKSASKKSNFALKKN